MQLNKTSLIPIGSRLVLVLNAITEEFLNY